MTLDQLPARYQEQLARQMAAKEPPVPPPKQTSVTFDLPYPPSVNHYWRHVGNRVHVSAEGRKYKQIAAQIAARFIAAPFDGPVALSLKVYRPRKAGDLDNIFKATCDALAKVVYHNDAQIVVIHAERFDDKENPRATVTVSALA